MKKILAIILAGLMLFACGCEKDSNDKEDLKEETLVYDIDEWLEICQKIYDDYNDETEYYSEDELAEKGLDVMKKSMRKNRVIPNCKIKLKGKVMVSSFDEKNCFDLVEKDTEEIDYDTENISYVSVMSDNENCIPLSGKIVEVEGTLSSANMITNGKILSPKNIEYSSLDNNIYSLDNEDYKLNVTAIGTVDNISTIKDIKDLIDTSESQDLIDLIEEQEDATHVLILSDADNTSDSEYATQILAFLNIADDSINIVEGDHIAISSSIILMATGEHYLTTSERFYLYDN